LEFVGKFNYEDLPDHLSNCDIMVLPSRWESFGSVCVESMVAGRAVIGSAAGGMADMIEHGKSGLLVPPRDPNAIAEAILSLVAEPGRVKELAETGRKSIVEKLSPERILPLQLASYERAIERCHERLSFESGRHHLHA
jgi:glycosyltransferase involved in cell wall biosynthesis